MPKYLGAIDQMMKCDYCYDRTSAGKRPMCATVCPSQALAFTTREQIERTRDGTAVNEWVFGEKAAHPPAGATTLIVSLGIALGAPREATAGTLTSLTLKIYLTTTAAVLEECRWTAGAAVARSSE